MEAEHTVFGLVRKRGELAGKIEHAQTVLRQLIIDLDNLDCTIRLFAPDIDLEDIKPRPVPPRHAAFKGEVSKIVFTAIRQKGPMTAQQLALYVMADRGLNAADRRLALTVGKRVQAAMRHYAKKGLVQRIKREGQHQLWELAR